MTETLRALERQAEVSGSVADAARVLAERLRRGTLTQERVELAAYVGDEAARLVAGCACASAGDEYAWACWCDHGLALAPWARGLSRWGEAACVRVVVAAGRVAWSSSCRCLTHNTALHSGQCSAHFGALDAAQAWIDCPCEEHRALWIEARALIQRVWVAGPADGHTPIVWLPLTLKACADLSSESDVRTAIRDSLVTWALT